ncbi:MAG: MarR family transcriptional regulator [Burkholderiaceae bacterium]
MKKTKQLERENSPRVDPAGNNNSVTITELLAYRLHQVANLVSRSAALRYKREFNVLLWEWRTIALLGAKGMLSLKELGKAAGLDKGQISRVAASLTERGLVLREIDQADGRKIRLSLTQTGQKLYKGLKQASGERNIEFLGCLTLGERRTLEGIMDKLESKAHELIQREREIG